MKNIQVISHKSQAISNSQNHWLRAMRHCLCLYVFVAWCLILFPQIAQAATYYVAANGNDGYTKAQAQNAATPWKTVNYGASQLIAGDTLLVRGGVYRESVSIKVNGNTAGRITIKAYPSETPILEGAQMVTGWTRCSSAKLSLASSSLARRWTR